MFEWIVRGIFFVLGVVASALVYRNNKAKFDAAVNAAVAAALKAASEKK